MAETASVYGRESYRTYRLKHLRGAAKRMGKAVLVFGMAGASAGGIVTAIVSPETFIGQPEPRVEAKVSDEDAVRNYIHESAQAERPVNVLEKAVAVRSLTRADGSISEQSITNPIWKTIDGNHYLAGKNALSQVIVWRLDEDVRLCQPEVDAAIVRPTRLDWNPNSGIFTASEVGVFRNHTEYPVADLCQVPADPPELLAAA